MSSRNVPETSTSASLRSAGRAAIASGAMGFISFALLIAYLTTTPSEVLESRDVLEPGVMPPLSRLLIDSSDVGFILQALLMIPVARALYAFGGQRFPGVSRAAVTVGLCAFGSVALLRLLALLNPQISGILFMGPVAFVGAWLIVVNWLLAGVLSRGLRIAGTIAGVGLLIQGASFFFLGWQDVLTGGPEGYANDEDFHSWNAIGGVPGSILYAAWAILLGGKLLHARDSSP